MRYWMHCYQHRKPLIGCGQQLGRLYIFTSCHNRHKNGIQDYRGDSNKDIGTNRVVITSLRSIAPFFNLFHFFFCYHKCYQMGRLIIFLWLTPETSLRLQGGEVNSTVRLLTNFTYCAILFSSYKHDCLLFIINVIAIMYDLINLKQNMLISFTPSSHPKVELFGELLKAANTGCRTNLSQ